MKRVTIEDVAKAAGVSRQTVSRAINGKNEISSATRDRVMSAVAELGYRPNRLAQSMVTQRTHTIGLILPDITNPFFPEVARGIQDVAREQDYNVLICNTDDSAQEELDALNSLAAQRVDGLAIFASNTSKEELTAFANSYRPILIVNRHFAHPHVNLLMVDNVRGGELAAEHFVAQGHTKIGMITNENFSLSEVRRVQGFNDTMTRHNLTPIIVGGQPTLDGGYEAAFELLGGNEGITAVFTYNDLMAIGTQRACRDLGKAVPDDIAIIGFDDIHLSRMVSPSISSIRVDKYELGRRAMERLLNMIDNPEQHFSNLSFEVSLRLRESTKSA